MYMVPGNCRLLGQQTTEGSPSWTWQAGGGSFLLLPGRLALSSRWLWPFNHVWKPPGRSLRSCYQFSLPATSLSRHMAMCTALVCGAQCSMPVRLGHWQSQTSNVCSGMTGQSSDRSVMSSHMTLSPPGPMSYLRGLAWRSWTSFWRREGQLVWTYGTLQWCSQGSLWHTGWWKAWAWEAQDDMEVADREGLQRVEALVYRPSQ